MFGKSHDDVKNIPDEFAENAIKVLKPGIEVMLTDGYRYDDGKRGFESHGRGAGRERNSFNFGSGGRGYYGPGGGDGKRFRRN
jgi:CO dehydrogenase/acetyl-CoA synthase alpha subunit